MSTFWRSAATIDEGDARQSLQKAQRRYITPRRGKSSSIEAGQVNLFSDGLMQFASAMTDHLVTSKARSGARHESMQ